jgi:hypothetical protein
MIHSKAASILSGFQLLRVVDEVVVGNCKKFRVVVRPNRYGRLAAQVLGFPFVAPQ